MKIYNGLDLVSQKITNLLNPTAAQDAATKTYADNIKNPIVMAVRRTANATSTATPGTIAALDFPTASMTEDFDASGFHNPATNSTRFTPTVAGTYGIAASVFWASVANTTYRKVILRTNGTTTIPGTQALANNLTSSNWSQPAPISIFTFNGTTDYLELCTDAGTASSPILGNSTDGPMVVMWLIR